MNLRTSWMKLHHRPLPSTQNWPSISREVMIIASVQGWRSSQSNARKRRGRLCWSGWWTIYCDANRTKKKPRSKMATGAIVYQCKVGLISMTWHLLTPLPRERSEEERKIQLVTPPTTTKLAQEIFEQWRWVSLWYIKEMAWAQSRFKEYLNVCHSINSVFFFFTLLHSVWKSLKMSLLNSQESTILLVIFSEWRVISPTISIK